MRRNYTQLYWLTSVCWLVVMGLILAACGDNPSPTTGPAIIFTTTNAATTAASITTTTAPATTVAAAVTTTTVATATQSRIVYDTQDNQIYLINPDSTKQLRIAGGRSPMFSPDGKRVGFVASEGQALGNTPLKSTITSVDLSGGDSQASCPTKANNLITLLSWSPKGKFIAFRSQPANDGGPGQVYLCTVATKKAATDPIQVLQGTVVGAYDWSPGGDYAAWQSGKESSNIYYGDPDLGGKSATNLSNSQNRTDAKLYERVSFSPDGKTIGIVGSKVFFISVPGQKSPYEGKTLDLAGPVNFAWSPDSKQVAVVEGGPNARSLKIVNLDDGKTVNLADKVGGGVDWSKP